jgi:hydrogenase nickel incorporation protein HypB
MCGTCGCGAGAVITVLADRPVPAWLGGPGPTDHGRRHPPGRLYHLHPRDEGSQAYDGEHGHDHPGHAEHSHGEHSHGEHGHGEHGHVHVLEPDDHGRTVRLQQKVLAKNDELAQRNREWLREHGILAVNLMSSPGSGKTTLLERTTKDLAGKMTLSVIEGDQETALDASRILAAGSKVVQINTGVGCHLDAEMVAQGLRGLDPPSGSIVVIENVGNLVCPALFDLGEEARVVLASVTEGADKPLKYPHMFRQADLVLLNKTDLLPYVEFDVKQYMADLRIAAPDALLLQISATAGDGIQGWYDWLRRRAPAPHEA